MSVKDAGLSSAVIAKEQQPPPLRVRYFHVSSFDIDDPLCPVPAIATAAKSPRPFSEHDSHAIDAAWQQLIRKTRKNTVTLNSKTLSKSRTREVQIATGHQSQGKSRLLRDISTSRRNSQNVDELAEANSSQRRSPRRSTIAGASEIHSPRDGEEQLSRSYRSGSGVESHFDIGESTQGTTGTPFVRAPPRTRLSAVAAGGDDDLEATDPDSRRQSRTRSDSLSKMSIKNEDADPPSSKVPTGTMRLHEIVLPQLQLQPIYWSPVNDVAEAIRATWFYKETMLPVETDVANLLEAGYVKLRPWTKTWADELNSALKVGPAGEDKVIHRLWPKFDEKRSSSRPGTSTSSIAHDGGDEAQARKDRALDTAAEIIDASTGLNASDDNKAAGKNQYGIDGRPKAYQRSGVLYLNKEEAYVIRPNMMPTASYGPYRDLSKGKQRIGLAVVRGFDQRRWEVLHPLPDAKSSKKVYSGIPSSISEQPSIPENPHVTDLLLVIHGIGQKLSERIESYNFTYAINSFRREFNVQLASAAVKPHLRKKMGSIMVLPVNWRSTLSFEEGGYQDDLSSSHGNPFSLKDITPDSLHNVRNIVSDVMLDVPYYLSSHHQPRILKAVVEEANRIYALWRTHNPGFDRWGRVHILAHSLGSVMAVDILSKQPTHVDPTQDFVQTHDHPEHFLFNTSNLFMAGSPAGFFLLLKKVALRPRTGYEKARSTQNDTDEGVGAETGTYGCLAVENIYNVLNPYDPVSYRLNAAVDTTYAASLKTAIIPSASRSWFSFGGPASNGYNRAASFRKERPNAAQRLPSTVELETHNFTKEEIAEKRAYLLNDNGQIDFFLRYGGGPLEIQYLTMLGAHSSYWTSNDFIRFLVIEIGREPGREEALDALKATKKKGYAS